MTSSVESPSSSTTPDRSVDAAVGCALVGVVFDASNPFEADLVDALYAAADRRAVTPGQSSYRLALSGHGRARTRRRAVTDLVGMGCDGIIVIGATHDDDLDLPAASVVIGERVPGLGRVTVGTDEWQGAHLAVQHLIDLGHNAIVHIGGGDHPCAAEWQRGYIGAMTAAGLQQHCQILRGDYTEEAGARVAHEILERLPRPTAVFLANDRMAFGFVDVMRAQGVEIPAEMSVVGYDDGHLAGVEGVELTTVRQDVPGLADAAIEALGRILAGVEVASAACGFHGEVALEPQLVVRSTTAAVKEIAVAPTPERPDVPARRRWGLMLDDLGDEVQRALGTPGLLTGSIEVVASASTLTAWRIADRLGIMASYGLYEDLLEDPDIDAVLVALPGDLGDDWARKAREVGKHVYRIG